jgi:uncharacterized protein (DUF58 family)
MRATLDPRFFRQLQQLKIVARKAFLGSRSGSHISMRRGHGLEFSDYRLYTPGDDFRHIDWNVYAKTDKVYIKEFREEQELNIMVLLDASASMAHGIKDDSADKFNLARDIAISLGYIGLVNGDSVTYGVLGKTISPRFVGARALSRVVSLIDSIKPVGTFSYVHEVRKAVSKLRLPGKCFFISDFLVDHVELFEALDLLRAKNYEITLIQILSPQELKLDLSLEQDRVYDCETGAELDLSVDRSSLLEYAKALSSHLEPIETYCRKSNLLYALLSSSETLQEVMLQRFPRLKVLT